MGWFGFFREHIKTLCEKKYNQAFVDEDTGIEIRPRAKRKADNLPDSYDDLDISRNGTRSWKDRTHRGKQYKPK